MMLNAFHLNNNYANTQVIMPIMVSKKIFVKKIVSNGEKS